MKFYTRRNLVLWLSFITPLSIASQSYADDAALAQCLSRELENADDVDTLGEIRERCNFEQNLRYQPDATPPSSGKSNVDERFKTGIDCSNKPLGDHTASPQLPAADNL